MSSSRPGDPYAELALGLISAQSFPAIVGVADRMIKDSSVTLVGYEQIGSGYCTAVVRGRTPDVRLAIETGRELAAQFGQETTSIIIPRPMPNLEEVLPIGSRLAQMISGQENNRFRDQAVGLIETKGFPAMVGAADAMLKSADVTFSAYHTTGAGLCTAIVRGTVSNVAAAIEVGMLEAERIGDLHAVMVIPRPLDDLERTLPIADCWVERLEPVRMPMNIPANEIPQQEESRQPLQPLELPIPQPVEVVPIERPAEVQKPLQPLRLNYPETEPQPEPSAPKAWDDRPIESSTQNPFSPSYEPKVLPEERPKELPEEPELMAVEPQVLAPLPTDEPPIELVKTPDPEPATIDIDAVQATDPIGAIELTGKAAQAAILPAVTPSIITPSIARSTENLEPDREADREPAGDKTEEPASDKTGEQGGQKEEQKSLSKPEKGFKPRRSNLSRKS